MKDFPGTRHAASSRKSGFAGARRYCGTACSSGRTLTAAAIRSSATRETRFVSLRARCAVGVDEDH